MIAQGFDFEHLESPLCDMTDAKVDYLRALNHVDTQLVPHLSFTQSVISRQALRVALIVGAMLESRKMKAPRKETCALKRTSFTQTD